jgi:hypothetical protein
MDIVLAKLAICLLSLSLIWGVISQRSRIERVSEQVSVEKWIAFLWIACRLIPFLVVFLLLGIEPTSDVNGFWYMASHAAEGKMVYRDFWSPYSPLYSYFLALGALVWNNPKVIVLTMIIVEGIAVWLSYFFFQPTLSKSRFSFKVLVYFLMPGSLILCVLGAQEDIWIWLFVILGILVRRKTGNVLLYSLVLALGVLMTKAIFVLFLLPLFLLEKQKGRFAWPLIGVGGLSLLILYLSVGMEFLQPMGEADTLRAPNIVSVFNPWTMDGIGMGRSFWNWAGLLTTLSVGCYGAYKWRNEDFDLSVTRIFIVMYATLMIVQQSAYSNYIFIFLLPLILILTDFSDRKFVSILLFYNLLCTVHPSFWWRSGMPKYHAPKDIFVSVEAGLDYAMQVGIVGLTVYLICYTLNQTEMSIRKAV